MPTMTEKRPKVTFDVSERVRRALALYATKYGYTIGDVIESLVSDHLAEYLQQADEGIATGTEAPKPRRGRKPKHD